MKLRKGSYLLERADATPMADLVFLLLIFFMLSSSFVMQPGIKVNLPAAVTSESQLGKHIFLTVNESYQIFLNEEPIRLEDLPKRFEEVFQTDSDTLLIVKADKVVTHGFVVDIMDIAKSSGANKIAIATQPTVRQRNF